MAGGSTRSEVRRRDEREDEVDKVQAGCGGGSGHGGLLGGGRADSARSACSLGRSRLGMIGSERWTQKQMSGAGWKMASKVAGSGPLAFWGG